MNEHGDTEKDPYLMAEILRKQYESTFSTPDPDRNIDNLSEFFFSCTEQEEEQETVQETEQEMGRDKEQEKEQVQETTQCPDCAEERIHACAGEPDQPCNEDVREGHEESNSGSSGDKQSDGSRSAWL